MKKYHMSPEMQARHHTCHGLLIVVLLTILDTSVFVEAASPMCYECSNIPFPRDCDRVMQCGADSQCYIDQFATSSGVVLYSTGCRSTSRCAAVTRGQRKSTNHLQDQNVYRPVIGNDAILEPEADIEICSVCCDGDYCNSDGCGSKALQPLGSRGPVCFNCHQHEKEDSCFFITVCDLNEICSLRSYVTGTGDRLYTTGCKPASQCDVPEGTDPDITAVGKRQTSDCLGCCATDFCNRDCTALQYQHNQSKPTTPNATVAPTSTDGTSSQSNSPTTSPTTSLSTAPTTSSSTPLKTSSSTSPTTHEAVKSTPFVTLTAITVSTRQSTVSTKVETSTPSTTSSTTTTTSTTAATTATTTLAPGARCNQAGYTYDVANAVCYKVFSQDRLQWDQARQRCAQDRGDLIIFRNKNEEAYFAYLITHINANKNYWVGASDIQQEGVWKWLDGTTVQTDMFHFGQPDNRYGENCGALITFNAYWSSGTLLNDGICYNPEHFICEIDMTTTSTVSSTKPPCRNSDYNYNSQTGICYKIYNQFPLNHWNARIHCQSQSADLLMLRNKTVEAVFQNMNFYDHDINHRYWLGAYRKPGDIQNSPLSFLWYNGREMDPNLQWHVGEPNNVGNSEDCLTFTYFNKRDGRGYEDFTLNDADCRNVYWYICEEKCPDTGYQFDQQSGLCFKVYNVSATWEEAKQRCAADKADLLELHQYTQMTTVRTHLKDIGSAAYWVGARDDAQTGSFSWLTTNLHVPDFFWHQGKPSSPQNGKHCAALTYSQTDHIVAFTDYECNTAIQGYVCQHIW